MGSITKFVENPGNPTSVLILQSASRALKPLLNRLSRELDSVTIDLLVPPGTRKIEDGRQIDNIFTLKNDRFDCSQTNDDQISSLREKQYDLCIALFNDVMDFGYQNVEKFARAIEANNVVGYDPSGRIISLDRSQKALLLTKRFLGGISDTLMDVLYKTLLVVLFIPHLIYRSVRNSFSD